MKNLLPKLVYLLTLLVSISIFSACSEEEIKPKVESHKGGLGEAVREEF